MIKIATFKTMPRLDKLLALVDEGETVKIEINAYGIIHSTQVLEQYSIEKANKQLSPTLLKSLVTNIRVDAWMDETVELVFVVELATH